jgi:hypothetical protein
MAIYVSSVCLSGDAEIGLNPLPCFRDPNPDIACADSGSLREEELRDFGKNAGRRVLPYLLQDRYSRKREPLCLKTVVLENELLRAEFLADFGGRLRSLKDLTTGRELLFANPVFQPGNLGIRNAWLSGALNGISASLGILILPVLHCFFPVYKAETEKIF